MLLKVYFLKSAESAINFKIIAVHYLVEVIFGLQLGNTTLKPVLEFLKNQNLIGSYQVGEEQCS